MRLSVAVIVIAVLLPAVPAAAVGDDFDPDAGDIYPLVFPVGDDNYYSDTWGAPRSGGRTHVGTDIIADKMIPVFAAASGTVGWMHNTIGDRCCAMSINHDDGWSTVYIHMNNDTPGTDDGLGWGFAPGIERGVHVEAGQFIGYVGDSGNAENTVSHIHFELIMPGRGHINPYPHLLEAIPASLIDELNAEPPCPDETECDSVALVDGNAQFHLMDEVRWQADQASFFYGNPGDYALMGDWDCDGIATPAMYRSSNGFMYLRNSNSQGVADLDYFYGDPSDIPLAGDFDGDGCDTLAIYRASEGKVYVKDSLGDGVADYEFFFGNPGDKPFVGDFDGDGIDTIGLHREETGFVYFRNSNDSGVADFEFFYGDPGDQILAGDWDGDGDDTVAVLRPSTGMLYVKLSNSAGFADRTIPVGQNTMTVLAGPSDHAGYSDTAPPPEPDVVWPDEVEQWREMIEETFLDPELASEALAIISCESNGDPNAVNPTSGASGLFQFMPSTWDWVASEVGWMGDFASGAPFIPEVNAAAANWLVQYSISNGQSAWHHWSCQP